MRLDTLCDVRWTYDVMESFDPADRLAPGNDEDGVAAVLEQLFLSP